MLALKHSTTPSITFPSPSLNLAGSAICLLAAASATPMAAAANDNAACFLSAPVVWPNNPSIPWTMAGRKAMPCKSLATKIIGFLLLRVDKQLKIPERVGVPHSVRNDDQRQDRELQSLG